MIYLKKWNTESAQTKYRESADYKEPYVGLVKENSKVYYNKYNGYEYVDFGLPSGTLWATCNIGATKPEDTGLYFAWGETKGYTGVTDAKKIEWSYYKFTKETNGNDNSSTVVFSKYNSVDNKTELDLEDDAAHVNMGGDWYMPSQEQFIELINNTKNNLGEKNGVSGVIFTSKEDESKTMFIPNTGDFDGNNQYGLGIWVWLWSKSLDFSSDKKYGINFAANDSKNGLISAYYRYYRRAGVNIRGVI